MIIQHCRCKHIAGLEEVLLASLADAESDAAHSRAPPASRRVVKALVRESLTDQRLEQLGGPETQCAVCRSADNLINTCAVF